MIFACHIIICSQVYEKNVLESVILSSIHIIGRWMYMYEYRKLLNKSCITYAANRHAEFYIEK